MDATVDERLGPRGCGAKVKGSDLASTSSHKLQAESGPHESEPTGHHEGISLDSFILAQMHSLSLSVSLCAIRLKTESEPAVVL